MLRIMFSLISDHRITGYFTVGFASCSQWNWKKIFVNTLLPMKEWGTKDFKATI